MSASAPAVNSVALVEDRPGIGLSEGADVPGAALITGSLMIGTYAILGITEHGWGSAQTPSSTSSPSSSSSSSCCARSPTSSPATPSSTSAWG